MAEDVPTLFEAIEMFNHREFYACHDALESIWNDAVSADKNFYQGILQIAVGLHHLGSKNWHGAAILLGEGISRLRYYQPDYENVDVASLIGESAELLTTLQHVGAEGISDLVQQIEHGSLELPKIQYNIA
jgi:uncharacterized protein